MLVFGERLAANEWAGIACIGLGLVIVSLRSWIASRRGERAPPEPVPLEGG
jgi:drug/metabolite transporter (DMT)-like permease